MMSMGFWPQLAARSSHRLVLLVAARQYYFAVMMYAIGPNRCGYDLAMTLRATAIQYYRAYSNLLLIVWKMHGIWQQTRLALMTVVA